MNAPDFHDGVFIEANRTNEASGRSWHVPADTDHGWPIWQIIAVLVVSIVLAGALAG